jgi:chromosome segregation ATPase
MLITSQHESKLKSLTLESEDLKREYQMIKDRWDNSKGESLDSIEKISMLKEKIEMLTKREEELQETVSILEKANINLHDLLSSSRKANFDLQTRVYA